MIKLDKMMKELDKKSKNKFKKNYYTYKWICFKRFIKSLFIYPKYSNGKRIYKELPVLDIYGEDIGQKMECLTFDKEIIKWFGEGKDTW